MAISGSRMPDIFLVDSGGKMIIRDGRPVINRYWFNWLENQIKSNVTADESSTPVTLAFNSEKRITEDITFEIDMTRNVVEELPTPIVERKQEQAIPTFSTDKRRVLNDVELTSTGAVYLGDRATDGSWKITRSGTGLVLQRRESGSWATKDTITA